MARERWTAKKMILKWHNDSKKAAAISQRSECIDRRCTIGRTSALNPRIGYQLMNHWRTAEMRLTPDLNTAGLLTKDDARLTGHWQIRQPRKHWMGYQNRSGLADALDDVRKGERLDWRERSTCMTWMRLTWGVIISHARTRTKETDTKHGSDD